MLEHYDHSSQQKFSPLSRPPWHQIHPTKWKHHCKGGRELIVTRQQLGLYWIDSTGRMVAVRGRKDRGSDPNGHWELDKHGGCLFCSGFPPELEALIARLRA